MFVHQLHPPNPPNCHLTWPIFTNLAIPTSKIFEPWPTHDARMMTSKRLENFDQQKGQVLGEVFYLSIL